MRPVDEFKGFYEWVGTHIRAERENKKITQGALAQAIGLTRTSINNIEHGKQGIPLHIFFEIAQRLGVAPGALLPDEMPAASSTGQLLKVLKQLHGKEKDWIASSIGYSIERNNNGNSQEEDSGAHRVAPKPASGEQRTGPGHEDRQAQRGKNRSAVARR